jgi:hypothetical protein
MDLPHITTVWIVRQGMRFAWAAVGPGLRHRGAGERLEAGLEAMVGARGVSVLGLLEPLTSPLRATREA